MKTIINTEALKKALKIGKLYAKPQSPKPILRNVLLTAENGRVIVASTDMEKTSKAFSPCDQILEDGGALLPSEAVKTLEKVKGETVTLYTIEPGRLVVESGAFKTVFRIEEIEEYPSLETETAPLFKTTGKDLARLARVGGFTEKENGRYALGGVLLDLIDAGKVYTVATDGRRMGVQELAANSSENAPQKIFILQGKPFEKAAKMLAKEANIRVFCSTKFIESVIFESDNFSISVPCLEGRFPEWRLGINQLVNPSISWMDRDALLSMETFAESVTDGTNPGVVFYRQDRQILGAWGVLGLNSGETTAPAVDISVDFPEVKLNWNFLKDFLKVAPAGELTVKTKDSRAGVLFETSDSFKYLVIPMHLDRKRPESTQAAQEAKPEQAPEQTEEKPTKKAPSKSAKKAPTLDASTPAAENTTPANEAPKTQENATQEDETKQAEKTTSAGAAVVLSSDDLRGDNFGKTLESVKNALTQGGKQEQKKEATWDGFLNRSKEVWINISMSNGRFPMKVIYFPAEKIAIVKHKKTWYAIEAVTGSAFYTMHSFHDLLNTLRHPENRTPILALIESVRSKNPALNPIDEEGNILDISPTEYEKMQAEGPKAAEKPEEKPEQEKEEKRVKIAPTESSAPFASVPEPEPMEAPTQAAAEPEPAPTPTEPEPNTGNGWEIGIYTTKKGKIKTSIRFFQPPTPAQIDALKTAFYWEYNGTWNGSPRKLPEIFKR